MLLPLFVALFQTPPTDARPAARDARPVRVWLGSSGVLTRGTPVRVYVQAVQEGNLIVLHRRTDGRIDVLFPGKPGDDAFVRAGTYEIQATPSRVAFVVAEPDGSGLVLAALAPTSYRVDEFVRAAEWNPDALAPSWDGSDGEGVLSDIVQRMLGDGYFNYDIATYTVAPPVYAMQQDTSAPYPMYPTCTDCTFIGFQQNVFEPFALCDPFFSPCIGDGRFGHHRRGFHEAPAPAPSRTIALSMRGSSRSAVIPQNGRTGGREGSVRMSATPVIPPIKPRARGPLPSPTGRSDVPVRALPLGPGRFAVASRSARPTVPTRRRTVSATVAPVPIQVVRLSLTPTRVEEPADASTSTGSVVLTGLTVTPPVQPAPRSRTLVPQPAAVAAASPVPTMVRRRGLAVAGSGSSAGRGGGGGGGRGGSGDATAPGRTQGIALPPAVFHGARARVPVTSTGVRRR